MFTRAVHETARSDYTAEQLDAWAPADLDLAAWASKRDAADTRVAEIDGRIVGFIDLDEAGYIDMLFVLPDYRRQGVATTLLKDVLVTATERGLHELTTHASLTARPFFEAHGFVVTAERHPVVRGIALTNFAMRRVL